MPSNVTTDPGSGGADIVTKQISHDGDPAQLQMIGLMGISGTEDSYTAAAINGDATNGIDVDVTRSALPTGASTAANQSSANALLTTIDADTGTLVTSNAAIQTAAEAIQTAVEGTLIVDATGQGDVPITLAGEVVTVDLAANNDVTVQGEDAENALASAAPVQVGGRYDATPRTLGDGDVGGLALDADGAVHISDGGNTITVDGTITANAGTNLNTSSLALESGGNLATLAGAVSGSEMQVDIVSSALPTGAATAANQSTANGLLTTIDTDTGGILTAVQLLDNTIIADDAAFTPGTTSVNMAGFTADEASTDSVDEGDAGAARMTLDRKQIVTPYAHAAAGGSSSHYRNIDANAEVAIKASAGRLCWMHVMNMTAAVAYVHLYDETTGNVTPGTTTPDFTFPIPTLGDTNGAGFVLPFGPFGQQFSTAITMVVTTTNDGAAGDPGTNGVFVNAGYE